MRLCMLINIDILYCSDGGDEHTFLYVATHDHAAAMKSLKATTSDDTPASESNFKKYSLSIEMFLPDMTLAFSSYQMVRQQS